MDVRFTIGVDTANDQFSYCLVRNINNKTDVILIKTISNLDDFIDEVENIQRYFNDVIVYEKKYIDNYKTIKDRYKMKGLNFRSFDVKKDDLEIHIDKRFATYKGRKVFRLFYNYQREKKTGVDDSAIKKGDDWYERIKLVTNDANDFILIEE